jgi:hypothetical protein
LIPAGQHPGVQKFDVPAVEAKPETRLHSDDKDLVRAFETPTPIPTTDSAVRSFMPKAEPKDIVMHVEQEVQDDFEDDTEPPEGHDAILELAGHDSKSLIRDQILADIYGSPDTNSGAFRSTPVMMFMNKAAMDPFAQIDPVLRADLDVWLIDTIKKFSSVETTIRDATFAITETGAKIEVDLKGLEKYCKGYCHIAVLRKLISVFGLGDYEQTLLLAEIDHDFGRAKELEREARAEKQAKTSQHNDVLTSLNKVVNAVEQLSSNIIPAISNVTHNPFKLTPHKDKAQTDKD